MLSIRRALLIVACLAFGVGHVRVRAQEKFPSRPLTVVCPWAAGGGTDRVSRQLAMQLEKRLGVPVNVINATGGKGVTGHHRGLNARPDGYTLTMMTFELCTMHWMGLTDLSYRDCRALVSVNEDYAALLVSGDAPWNTLSDLEAAIRSSQLPLTASGTAAGGAWHLAQAGWLDAASIDASKVSWVPSAGSSPSLQQLIAGGVDMVCCSLPEARTLLDSGDVRALGVMAPVRAVGFEGVPTFEEQGRRWQLGGWRGVGLPRDVPENRVAVLQAALEDILSQPMTAENSFRSFMDKQRFDATTRFGEDFESFMAGNDAVLGKLIASPAMESTRIDRFSPLTFPLVLLIILVVSVVCGAIQRVRAERVGPDSLCRSDRRSSGPAFLVSSSVLLTIVAYCLLAESLGFIITAVLVMLVIGSVCGVNSWRSTAVAVLLPVGVFMVFSWGMRVGLPLGIFP